MLCPYCLTISVITISVYLTNPCHGSLSKEDVEDQFTETDEQFPGSDSSELTSESSGIA